MAKTYAEYLREQGADDATIATLDTPIGRRAFDTMQAALETEAANAAAAIKARDDYKATADDWFQRTETEYKRIERESLAAKANEARARALVKAASDQGLLQVAKDMGFDDNPKPPEPTAVDPRYVTRDSLMADIQTVGDSLAGLEDMVMEHAQLFGSDPSKRLRVRELRKEALAAGKNIEQYWADKYHVQAAREKRESDDRAAYEAKLRKEGEDAATARFASQYGNPETRPLTTSNNPFAPRPDHDRTKQPWEQGDRSTERVRRATEVLMKNATAVH